MSVKRRVLALAVASGLVVGACGVSHDASDQGVADEPTSLGVVRCDASEEMWNALVYLNDGTAEADALVAKCDHRVTGAPCEEDELCAMEQIWETEDFTS